MSAFLFGTVLPWLLLALGTWLGYQIVRQNGRILIRLDSIENRLAPRAEAGPREAEGLSRGAEAPDFELPDLAGAPRRLTEFRGWHALLLFFDPKCGFCTKMAADLAALPVDGANDRPVPIVVTTGDPRANQRMVEMYGIRCVVLQQQAMEVANRFLVSGTPMGYLIDAGGRIASELAVGAEPLLKLAGAIAPAIEKPEHATTGDGPSKAKDYQSLAGSRLNRSGLKPGIEAPGFRLPTLDGGELAFSDFRGSRVLLVFSDPDCGPCDELAPQLQDLHSRRNDVQVLVVSRRDPDANRAKAARLRLSFPILLQKAWEISLKYAMFATPVGYLIDADGFIASDVAVGVGPILALANDVDSESCGDPASPRHRNEHAGVH